MKENTHHHVDCLALGLLLLSAALLSAAEPFALDFSVDPGGQIEIISNAAANAEWRAAGGEGDSGYLALTDAVNDSRASIIFADPTGGEPVRAFKFGVDCRIGGGTANPADGFSINLVRPTDPLLSDEEMGRGEGWAGGYPELGGLPEEGSKTGLAIGFDTWENGVLAGDVETDRIGFSVRVDNALVAQVPATTKNGEGSDVTSLQTGPLSADPANPYADLTWQRFEVELREDGTLDIYWKGIKVVDNLQTAFFPTPGQLVFGARTGGANEAHHFDNLYLEINPAKTIDLSLDFEEDPADQIEIISNAAANAEWRPSGGVDDSGYLALTDAVNDSRASIIFADSTGGEAIQAFEFGIDCRIGGGTASPADGFSINLVRPNDPLLSDEEMGRGEGWAGGYPELGGLPEEGSKTGLAIGFDTWENGVLAGDVETDRIGFSVRVDNELVAQVPATTKNGAGSDVSSLQTGPLSSDPDDPYAALTWQRFEVKLKTDGKLDIFWKGVKVVDNLQTDFFPTPGQLVFGARTGGANEAHHFDNLFLSVQAAELAVVSGLDPSRGSVTFEFTDTGKSAIQEETITLLIDGQAVVPTVMKTDKTTTVTYTPSQLFEIASIHSYALSATDSNGNQVGRSGSFSLPEPLFPEERLPGPEGGKGFFAVRYIWDAGAVNSVPEALRLVREADQAGFAGQVFDTTVETLNTGAGLGLFPDDDPFPAELDEEETWTEENFVYLAKGFIQITQGGDYTFGARTDDGFALRIEGLDFEISPNSLAGASVDPDIRSIVSFVGTTGDSMTWAVARDVKPGVYPVEFLWFNAGGEKFSEFYSAQGVYADDSGTDTWSLLGNALPAVEGPGAGMKVLRFTLGGNNLMLEFTTADSAAPHVIQHSETMESGTWTDLETSVEALSEVQAIATAVIDAAGGRAMEYFRVAQLAKPPIYGTSFENGEEGWVAGLLPESAQTATNFELGTPAFVGVIEGAHSGENAWGTDLTGPYAPGALLSLTSPVIDLTNAERPRLRFSYFTDSTFEEEGARILFLDENENLLLDPELFFWGQSGGWLEFNRPIPAEVRGQKVKIQFHFLSESGADDNGAGFYLDDVFITD